MTINYRLEDTGVIKTTDIESKSISFAQAIYELTQASKAAKDAEQASVILAVKSEALKLHTGVDNLLADLKALHVCDSAIVVTTRLKELAAVFDRAKVLQIGLIEVLDRKRQEEE